jgi:uncharacterized protein (DUF2345 family)
MTAQESNPHSALAFMNNPVGLSADAHPDTTTGSGSKLSLHSGHNVQFSAGQAIIWQIKFIINCYLNKKTIAQASIELQLVSAPVILISKVIRKIRDRFRPVSLQGAH